MTPRTCSNSFALAVDPPQRSRRWGHDRMSNEKGAPAEEAGPNDNDNLDGAASISGASAENEYATGGHDQSPNCTELGNAQRLVYRFGHDLHYCPDQRRWFVWDRVCWRPDLKGAVEVLAKK